MKRAARSNRTHRNRDALDDRRAPPGPEPRSATALTPGAVLALQRTAGNRATVQALTSLSGQRTSRAVLQRQKPQGPYSVSQKANFRADDAEHRVIRALEAGTRVEVIDKGGRTSKFKAGFVSNEHSWSRHQAGQGWIEDSKLTALPMEVEEAGDDDDLEQDIQAPPQPQHPRAPGPPPPPGRGGPLTRLYQGIDNERGEVRHYATELQTAAQRVPRPLPGTLTAEQRANAVAWIDAHIVRQQGGGGGDHIKRVREAVPGVVAEAANAGYNIRNRRVRELLPGLAMAVASCEGTQMGQHQGGNAMGAFFEGQLPAHQQPPRAAGSRPRTTKP